MAASQVTPEETALLNEEAEFAALNFGALSMTDTYKMAEEVGQSIEPEYFKEFLEKNGQGAGEVNVGADIAEEAPQEAQDFATYIRTRRLGVTEILTELRSRLDEWEKIPLNIAVVGESGHGKSTFINTLRRIPPGDPRTAKTGVNQTTATPTPYEHADFPNVQVWDIPGVGTRQFPKETYLKQIKFDTYDFFIILFATRLTENAIWLAQEVQRAGKHCYILRSKIDIDVCSDKEDNPKTHNEQMLLEHMRDSCIKELKEAGIKNPSVFLVCRYPELYQFGEFEMKAISDLPELKGEKLLYISRGFSKERIELITKKLQKRSWLIAMASAGVAAIPIPLTSVAFDIGVILAELAF